MSRPVLVLALALVVAASLAGCTMHPFDHESVVNETDPVAFQGWHYGPHTLGIFEEQIVRTDVQWRYDSLARRWYRVVTPVYGRVRLGVTTTSSSPTYGAFTDRPDQPVYYWEASVVARGWRNMTDDAGRSRRGTRFFVQELSGAYNDLAASRGEPVACWSAHHGSADELRANCSVVAADGVPSIRVYVGAP